MPTVVAAGNGHVAARALADVVETRSDLNIGWAGIVTQQGK
jgi:hypothetical protein